MELAPVVQAGEWNPALLSLPNAHVLQSWQWGEIKSRYGWSAARWLFLENGTTCAAAQILRRPLPHTPYGVLYLPKGPAVDYDNTGLFANVLAELERYARQTRSIFVKLDPDILAHSASAGILVARGWRPSSEQIQFRNTVMLDLTRTEEELLAGMKPKWRYNIRLAQKKGVRVEAGGLADLSLFYKLYSETSARDGFLIRPFSYYADVWTTMLGANLAQILFARVGAETVAALMLFVFGSRAWYFYGASRNSHRELMPNHLLQWEAIRWARANGCQSYDFWGAPDQLNENEPMYGVYKFKLGFGAHFVERIPAHDFVVNPTLYWLYAVVRPKYLERLRKRNAQTGFE